jgi:hypothetical protein
MDKISKDLSGVKAGDVVVWCGVGDRYVKMIVDCVTDTKIIIDGCEFKKDDGIRIMDSGGWYPANASFIVPATQENEKKIIAYQTKESVDG